VALPQFARLAWIPILAAGGLIVQAQTQQPVFKSAVIHVRVDVIATDKNDKPVTDLTASDFEIRQNGVLQTISDFEHVSIPPIDRKIDLAAPQPPPPDTFTNAPPPPSARAFVFVMWGLSPEHIVPIKRMMTSFVSALQPDDEVAIVYGIRSDISQDFTSDTTKLVRAINNLRGGLGFPPLRDWLFSMHNVMQSLNSAREPRKVMIFVSEGFPLRFPMAPEVPEIFRESIRLNIPIYTMDPRGLMAPPLGLQGHMEDQIPNGLERIRGVQKEKEGLQIIAENTNGRAFVNNWNVPQSAAELIGDNNSYYLLGFYPSPYQADGKAHDFDVKVTRPGVRVRARQSYTSDAPPAADAKPPRLIDNLGAGLPGGELLLRATAAPLAPGAKGVSTLLTMDVNYPSGAGGHDRLDLVWIAIDPDGKPRASGQNSVTVDLLGNPPHVTIHDAIDLPKGLLTIRATLASQVTGTNGTVHVPIEVRDLATKRPEVAALVLTRVPAPPTQLLEIGNGLRLSPTTPTTGRTFATSERLRILARVFSGPGVPVTWDLSLTMPNGETRGVPTTRSVTKTVANSSDYLGDLALKDLPAGKYVLTFSARDASSKNARSVRATTFEVK
jgi:VWFA-related protein